MFTIQCWWVRCLTNKIINTSYPEWKGIDFTSKAGIYLFLINKRFNLFLHHWLSTCSPTVESEMIMITHTAFSGDTRRECRKPVAAGFWHWLHHHSGTAAAPQMSHRGTIHGVRKLVVQAGNWRIYISFLNDFAVLLFQLLFRAAFPKRCDIAP